MSKAPTNTDLARIVHEGFNEVNSKFGKLERKVQTVHDFMVGEQAIKANNSNGKSVGFTKEMLDIIKWLVVIVGALIGVSKVT